MLNRRGFLWLSGGAIIGGGVSSDRASAKLNTIVTVAEASLELLNALQKERGGNWKIISDEDFVLINQIDRLT